MTLRVEENDAPNLKSRALDLFHRAAFRNCLRVQYVIYTRKDVSY